MDESEFTDLIRRHAGLIHKIAYAYCRGATDREDVVQEIAVQLWRARDRYDERYRHTTWIYRIALNVAISFYRRERRHREHGLPIEEGALVAIDAVDPASPGEDIQLLLRCIDGLGALEKALVLLYLDGNDHAAIAEVLGISVSNVGTKLGRLVANLVFGVIVLVLGQAWSKRYVERPGLGPRARRLIDALSGRSLRAVASHLTELSRFERDEPAA